MFWMGILKSLCHCECDNNAWIVYIVYRLYLYAKKYYKYRKKGTILLGYESNDDMKVWEIRFRYICLIKFYRIWKYFKGTKIAGK